MRAVAADYQRRHWRKRQPSTIGQANDAPQLVERISYGVTGTLSAFRHQCTYLAVIAFQLLGAFTYRGKRGIDVLDQAALALEAPDGCLAASTGGPLKISVGCEALMKTPQRTTFRITGITTPHARRVGGHVAYARLDFTTIATQEDGLITPTATGLQLHAQQ